MNVDAYTVTGATSDDTARTDVSPNVSFLPSPQQRYVAIAPSMKAAGVPLSGPTRAANAPSRPRMPSVSASARPPLMSSPPPNQYSSSESLVPG